jgi:hypothetical protein
MIKLIAIPMLAFGLTTVTTFGANVPQEPAAIARVVDAQAPAVAATPRVIPVNVDRQAPYSYNVPNEQAAIMTAVYAQSPDVAATPRVILANVDRQAPYS